LNFVGSKPLNKRWMASFRKDKKMDDYLGVGEPLMQWLALKGEWRKMAVRCTAIECLAILKHAKAARRLYVVIRGKGGEHSNFTEAIGEMLIFTEGVSSRDELGIAFPGSAKSLVVTQAKGMPNNWKKLAKNFNCTTLFFVYENGEVEVYDWMKVLAIKI